MSLLLKDRALCQPSQEPTFATVRFGSISELRCSVPFYTLPCAIGMIDCYSTPRSETTATVIN